MQLTGQGMRDYMASNVFPALGIDNNLIGWAQNSDGVETANTAMFLSAYDMAKYGQLYLQNGMSTQDDSLVSTDWIEESFKPFVEVTPSGFGIDDIGSDDIVLGYYGHMWYIREYDGSNVYCASGTMTQIICVHPETERVFVRKSDNESPDDPMMTDFAVVFSDETVFKEEDLEQGIDVDIQAPSSASSVVQGWLFVAMVATGLIVAP